MSYSPPAGVANASWQAGEYGQAVGNITGSWNTARRLSPTSIEPPATPAPRLIWQQFAAPAGIQAPSFGAARALREDDYLFPQHVSNASWVGADSYAGPLGFVRGSWSQSARPLAPIWTEVEVIPAPTLQWTLFISPAGIDSAGVGESYVLHDYQYAYPEYTIVASWVGRGAYSGAPGEALNGQWQKERESLDLAPLGIDDSVVSEPVLSLMRAYIEPQGTDLALFGAAAARNAGIGVKPAGIASQLQFGPANVVLWRRFIWPSGPTLGRYGTPKAELYRNYLRPTAIVGTTWGSATLAGGLRTIDLAGRATNNFASGRPTITFRERIVNPVGYDARQIGLPLMGYARQLLVEGLDAARFGATDVWDNTQKGYASGFDSLLAGFPFIAPRVRTLEQRPLVSPGAIGAHELRNRTRYVTVYTEPGTWGPFFGNFAPYVSNRNRTIATYGHASSRFSLAATIENAAVPLRARPFDAALFGDSMVAYSVRRVHTPGWDASVLSRWASVNNGARVLAPPSISSAAAIGLAKLVNTRRFITWTGGADTAVFGVAYADYRIRTIEQILPSRPSYVPIPKVHLQQRFIAAEGFGGVRIGMPFVEEHFTRFFPRWVFVEQMGNPTLVNRNREVGAYGYDLAEFGRARLHLHIQNLEVPGTDFLTIGKPRIADSQQVIGVQGALVFRIGNGTRVQLYQPDLPYTRTLFPSSIVVGVSYGKPALRGNSLYPLGIESAMRAGRPTLVSMGISPKGIFLEEQYKYGRPTLNFDQYIAVASVAAPDNKQRHRVDPHTIWCTYDTPQQASVNHDGGGWRAIDYSNIDSFGRPVLRMTGPQIATTRGSSHHAIGQPRLDLRVRYIQLVGFNTYRYGWPRLPGLIECGPLGIAAGAVGRPTVAHYVDPMLPRTITGKGYSATGFGNGRIELFNRALLAKGWDASILPRVMRVGPPRRLEAMGSSMELFGTHWASLRVRHLAAEGFDGYQEGYETGGFALRMRVRVAYPAQRVTTAGSGGIVVGRPMIHNRAMTIRPLNCCCAAALGRPVAAHHQP